MLRRFGAPLELAEVARPQPGPGEALVRVRATGICATDLKLASGALPGVALPRIPGHEVAGELAEAAGGLPAGARVACALYDSCAVCDHCRAGRPTLCTEVRRIGIERDGGLAEYLTVPEESLLAFGDSISFAEAAVCMDAVTTPWRALRVRGALVAGESVAVIGAGGLGLNAIQVALDCGARVAAVEPNAERRQLALELGAELAVPPEQVEAVRDWAGQGVDLAFDGSGVRAGFDTALATVAPGGRVACCGYRPGLEYGIDSGRLVLEEITLLGSRAGGRADAREALAAVEEGRIAPPVMQTLPLERVNEALEALSAGSALGRIVISPAR